MVWKVTKPRTLGVRALVIDADGRIALVRHTYGKYWYLPGGGVKKGEAMPAALKRELREELAIREFRVERVLGLYLNRLEGKEDHVAVYVVRVDAGHEMARNDRLEIADCGWFALDALPEGLSPGTERRLSEWRGGTTGDGRW
jgi:8-oxo-dGTP pyrophosphatase MutT (NUDIX family)